MTPTLFYSPGSCSLAPHIVLEEVGCPFGLQRFSTADGSNFSDDYRAINPTGMIPTLQIDGFQITENPAILAFLGRRFSGAGLYPDEIGEAQARCLQWLAWSSNTAHVAFAQVFRPERYVLAAADHAAVMDSGRQNYARCLERIDTLLQAQPYALGEAYTVVDPFWLVLYRWGDIAGFDMRRAYGAFTEHAERLSERDAVQRALHTEGIVVWR